MKGKNFRGHELEFGEYGLKAKERGWLKVKQIEATRKAIVHCTKRKGKIWIRVLADKPITKKGAGVRMGGGKGDIETYVAVITPGKILFEIAGLEREVARQALKLAAAKLPFKTIFIQRT